MRDVVMVMVMVAMMMARRCGDGTERDTGEDDGNEGLEAEAAGKHGDSFVIHD